MRRPERGATVLALDARQLLGDADRLRRIRTSHLPDDPGALRGAARALRGAAYSAKVAAERLEHRAHLLTTTTNQGDHHGHRPQ